MSEYVKTFKDKYGDINNKDKGGNINNKFMFTHIDDKKLLQKPFGLGLKTLNTLN